MSQRYLRIWGMAIALAALTGFAAFLAANRIYQVDEAQNLFMTRVLGSHQVGTYFTNAVLWMIGPLAWLAGSAEASANLFFWARMVFLVVFLLNLFLLALSTGVPLRSERGLAILLGAATLAPLWDYGFEIRHDNLILTGLLLIWWAGRVRTMGLASYALIGFLTVTLVFFAFKAFAYVVPLSAAFLVFPPPGHGARHLRLGLAWLTGCVSAFLLVFLVYQLSGHWEFFLAGFKDGLSVSKDGSRFGVGLAMGRLITQTPLLLGLVVGALIALGFGLRLEGRKALTWEGSLPEAVLALGAFGVLLINPTPFPYNLVNLVPFGFLLAIRAWTPLLDEIPHKLPVMALLSGVILFTHFMPFGVATWRHLERPNHRQVTLMQIAEALTDPTRDPVYDAVGMVPTRPSIGFHWYLHSLNIERFQKGEIPSVSQMLTERPAAVLIRNYRTDWMPETDRNFIQARYLPLADDFWILGQVLPPGGGTYSVVQPGRYRVVALRNGQPIADLSSIKLNGNPVGNSPVSLEVGPQQINSSPGIQAGVIWVGPHLDRVPQLEPGSHYGLFVNWY